MLNKEKKVQPTSKSGNSTKPRVSGIPQRTYKFRGKSNGDIDVWIYGYYHFDKQTNLHYICSLEKLIRYEVKPETVGRLLVVYDDVEYYENDIIKDWSGTRELKFEIMDDEQGCFLQLDDTDLCVLGNVFDNPELLE
jgi:hypothetical protein